MGMFDWINFKASCPKCGKEVSGFQSKDGNRMLGYLEFWQVDNFYSYCEDCDAMVDYVLKEDKRKQIDDIMKQVEDSIEKIRKSFTIDDYDVEFREITVLKKEIEERLDDEEF